MILFCQVRAWYLQGEPGAGGRANLPGTLSPSSSIRGLQARPPAFGTRPVHESALDLHGPKDVLLVAGALQPFPSAVARVHSLRRRGGALPVGFAEAPRCHSDPGRALDAKAREPREQQREMRSWRLRAATPIAVCLGLQIQTPPPRERRWLGRGCDEGGRAPNLQPSEPLPSTFPGGNYCYSVSKQPKQSPHTRCETFPFLIFILATLHGLRDLTREPNHAPAVKAPSPNH